jgi:hypothetical protein
MLAVVGCLPGSGQATPADPAGFFLGVWHGWIAPLSLIAGLFDSRIRLYEVVNTGWGYDFGFYMAIIAGFGGLGLTRRKKKHGD